MTYTQLVNLLAWGMILYYFIKVILGKNKKWQKITIKLVFFKKVNVIRIDNRFGDDCEREMCLTIIIRKHYVRRQNSLIYTEENLQFHELKRVKISLLHFILVIKKLQKKKDKKPKKLKRVVKFLIKKNRDKFQYRWHIRGN